MEQTFNQLIEIEKQKIFTEENKRGAFCIGGPIDFSKYQESKYKLLFINWESYGYDLTSYPDGIYIKEHITSWLRDRKVKANRVIAMIAYAFFSKIEKNIGLTLEEFVKLDSEYEKLDYSISKVAVINANKYMNLANNSDPRYIRKCFKSFKDYLLRAIEVLKPDIIICGGQVVCDGVFLDLSLGTDGNYKFHDVNDTGDKLIACQYHPSVRKNAGGVKKAGGAFNYFYEMTNKLICKVE